MTDDLVSTIDAPGDFDALSKLRPGEPYFAFIGRDRLAPPGVLDWADKNRRRAHEDFEAGRITEEQRDYELRKSTQAESVAWAMQAYKRGEPVDSPPVDRDATEHYSGFKIDPTTAQRDKRRTDLIHAAGRIHNAISDLSDAADLMREHGHLLTGNDVRSMVKSLKRIADRITPGRAGITNPAETAPSEAEDE